MEKQAREFWLISTYFFHQPQERPAVLAAIRKIVDTSPAPLQLRYRNILKWEPKSADMVFIGHPAG